MQFGRARERFGKAEANAGPATGGGGGAVQDNDEQLRDVQDNGVPCGGCERIRTGAAEPRVEDIGAAVEKKAADEVRRHYELLVEDMEVA
jgi:hypothetical protein